MKRVVLKVKVDTLVVTDQQIRNNFIELDVVSSSSPCSRDTNDFSLSNQMFRIFLDSPDIHHFHLDICHNLVLGSAPSLLILANLSRARQEKIKIGKQ